MSFQKQFIHQYSTGEYILPMNESMCYTRPVSCVWNQVMLSAQQTRPFELPKCVMMQTFTYHILPDLCFVTQANDH